MKPKLSVVIPAYNESVRLKKTLPQILDFFRGQKYPKEIIIVDDGSSDSTSDTVQTFTQNSSLIKLITQPQNQGKGAALRTGVIASSGEWVLFMDADLSTPLEELDKFWIYTKNFDVVIGSRKMSGANVVKHQSLVRENLGKIFTALTNILATKGISDITCGFKLFRGPAGRKLFKKSVLNDWSFDAEILYLAQKKSLSYQRSARYLEERPPYQGQFAKRRCQLHQGLGPDPLKRFSWGLLTGNPDMFMLQPIYFFPLVQTALFVWVYALIFIFLPAFLLIKKLPLSKWESLSFSLVFGFSLYALLVYLARMLSLPFFIVEIILSAVLIFHLPRNRKFRKPGLVRITIQQILFIPIALMSALVHSAVLIRSAWPDPSGIRFVNLSFHDTMQHLSIIGRLFGELPPPHPGFSGSELINYHYLIDLALAALARFSFVSLYDLYYRIYPLSISLIFSISVFSLVRRLTRSEAAANFAVLFTIFSGNASYFVHFFRGNEYHWSANAFMINPIVDLLQNPASIFVLAQTLSILHLVFLRLNLVAVKKVQPALIALFIGVIAGTMIGFKAWGGLLILSSLFSASLWRIITAKKPVLIFSWLVSLAVALVVFLPHYDPDRSAGPIWAPGWILTKLHIDADRWNDIEPYFRMEHYIYTHNTKRLALLYAGWVALYFFGNFWLRSFGFFYIFWPLTRFIKMNSFQVLLMALTAQSLLLPLLFNQGRMAYDIEQFAPYATLTAAVFTLILLYNHLFTTGIFRRLPIQLLVLGIFFSLTFPSNLTSIIARSTGVTSVINQDELDLFRKVNAAVGPESTVLLYPSKRNVDTLEFAAMTNRNTHFSGRTLSIITGEDYETRKEEISRFFHHFNTHERQAYATEHGIDYIFLYSEDRHIQDLRLDPFIVIVDDPAGSLYYLPNRKD